jgi:hypothetical protein
MVSIVVIRLADLALTLLRIYAGFCIDPQPSAKIRGFWITSLSQSP